MEIRLKNLTKIFPNKKAEPVVAVNNFNITIPSGKLVGLLGPSGCGKSTTLYMISGLQDPTSGQIFFGDDDVTKLPPEKRGIGLVFQNYALYPHMTVRNNILFPLQNLKVGKAESEERAMWAAHFVQIDELMDRKPNELSGGQQQRVAIARAIVKEPQVLLLDEPLSNLDARLRLQTREEIKRIQKETGITTVFVTHDQEEAMSISDVIIVMNFGVIQQVDEPQKVYENPINLFVAKFLGTPPINVFRGTISNGGVYIGSERVMETKFEDQEVFVGIRPEGFIVDSDGTFTMNMNYVEKIGRDMSIIANHPCCEKPTTRIIVDADTKFEMSDTIKFALKPNKVFLFNADSQERLGYVGPRPSVGEEESEPSTESELK